MMILRYPIVIASVVVFVVATIVMVDVVVAAMAMVVTVVVVSLGKVVAIPPLNYHHHTKYEKSDV